MPSPPAPDGSTRFGRYRLIQQLGAGGMAQVFRAVVDGPEGFQRALVLKRIRPELSSNETFVKMFLAEARLSAMLHHPAIVQVYDLGDVDGEFFLALEYVDGHDLANVLRQARERSLALPPGVAAYIALTVADALAYAHERRDDADRPLEIVHRDVSPANIMITREGAVKLLDFGIAKAASHVRDERTRTGTLKGKISYMSPEQADGRAVDKRSDVFALGIVLYECLTGTRLFRGDDDLETLRLIREARVRPPSSERAGLAPELDAIVLKMLARTPEERYQTCDEVIDALQPIVHELRAGASTLRSFLQSLGPVEAATPVDEPKKPREGTITRTQGEALPATEPEPPRSSRRSLAAVAAVVAASAAGVLLYTHAQPRPKPAQPPIAVAPPVAAPPPVEPPPPPAPTRVQITVNGPKGARLLLDGKKAGPLPATLTLDRSTTPHHLVVHLHDAIDATQTVVADRDQSLTLTPTKKKAARKPDEN